jgi:hypothetical protein
MLKNENIKLNDSVISLSNFAKGAKEGINRFLILDAKFDTILTKSGETKDVIVLQVQLTHTQEQDRQETLQGYRVFVDFSYKSQFHQMILSATTALGKEDLPGIREVIGLEGTVALSYYKPDEERSFARLNNWNFFVPTETMATELSQYADELSDDESADWGDDA